MLPEIISDTMAKIFGSIITLGPALDKARMEKETVATLRGIPWEIATNIM